jgi:microsomal dipeptidase-like Zn-dependent dipeptidase
VRFPVRGLLALAALLACAGLVLGANAERFANRVEPVPLPAVSEAARRLHASSLVVDLHADSLLFGRDLLARSRVGHVDLPRLVEGGVGLQVLAFPTRVPLGFNIERTDGARPDLLTWLGLARLSPLATRGPLGRALLAAERLDSLVARAGGALLPVRTRADLDALLARRRARPDAVGVLLGLEGAHALEGDPANLEVVFRAGHRLIGLAHFFDNEFAGSAHGLARGGLSEKGRTLVARMQELGLVVDLAHASPATVDDALVLLRRPALVSHGGVRATCDNPRNLSDAQLRALARGGGVIGIGYWDTAVCGTELTRVTAALRHVVELVGDDHAALGSDWDGGTTVGFDAAALPALTQQLLDEGLPEASVRKILGGNALRVLREVLPAG